MSQVQYSCAAPAERDRLNVALRLLFVIPHAIVLVVLLLAAYVTTIVQWFTIVFTGARNDGMWEFSNKVLGYLARVSAYQQLQHDQFPAFGLEDPTSPVQYSLGLDPAADRLTNGLRFIWIIPAAVIAYFLNLAANACATVSWFMILFTGVQPPALHEFIGKAVRYNLQTTAYGLLLTDEYPTFA